MSLKTIGIIAALLLVIIAAGVVYFAAPSKNYDEFAKCLTARGATLYGAFWCQHCKKQKEAFGNSMQFINYVECSTPDGRGQTATCQLAGITGYPTWEFQDGSRLSGFIELPELAQKTGCTLP